VIAWSRLADHSAARVGDLPTPDVIYSVVREPHHQSPFLTWQYFRENWLPGYVEAAAMLVVCLGIARWGAVQRWRVMAAWLAGLLVYLFVVLGPKYFDRDSGVLGKFYLFRPSSLTLFLWLLLVIAVAIGLAGRRAWLLRVAMIVGVAPAFLYLQGDRLVREVSAHQMLDGRKRALEAAVMRATGAGAIVLIDPEVEMQFLDFERRTGRPTWVMWKFAPTNDAELLTWYRRMEVRRVLFERGCGGDAEAGSIDFLLTTSEHASRLAATCGAEVARVDDWVLLRRVADH